MIAVFAAVLGLSSADSAAVGAAAVQLERALHIGNVKVGLLVTVSTAVSALATLPAGVLTDRINRARLLTVAVLGWSVAMALGGMVSSYEMLLATRVALGALSAVAGPTVASLIGDFFPSAERGRVYGFVLSGELIGAAVGLFVSADLAAALSWRFAFWSMGAVGLLVAWFLWRRLTEPARDGSSRLAGRVEQGDKVVAGEEAVEEGVPPHEERVLRSDPTPKPLWWALRYVLSIRTNVVLILTSALGYYFFSAIRTFPVVFVRSRFGLGTLALDAVLFVVGLGALAGVQLGGRLGDGLLRRHHLSARPAVSGTALALAAVFFGLGLLTRNVLVAIPFFVLGAAGLGAANPPMDAARLDVMPSRLWGRAEAVRTVLRSGAEALAPVTFGYLSVQFGATGSVDSHHAESASTSSAVASSFLVMATPLLVAGLVLLVVGSRTYPRDVATAVASTNRISESDPEAGSPEQ